MIRFNKPHLTGKEIDYIKDSVSKGKISGNGIYTQKCQSFFEKEYGFKKTLLTTSCTDALEMAAILLNLKEGDEIIMPSYTFVSTANAFVLRGAKIIFADSEQLTPNIDAAKIEPLISKKTKAIVIVHYAGISCNMDAIINLAKKHNLFVIEDAAQAIDSYYKSIPLGSMGDLATLSFHETKNIISGEGGMLIINNDKFIERAEIIWEKGTNRAAFFRGEIDKYGWVDIGSSFLPSEIVAAFLWAQLENLKDIQQKRLQIWNYYNEHLKEIEIEDKASLPYIPEYASNNGHIFYLVCKNLKEREALIAYLKKENIHAVFHYQGLHQSKFYKNVHKNTHLPNCERYSDCLLRLPLFYDLNNDMLDKIISYIKKFYTI